MQNLLVPGVVIENIILYCFVPKLYIIIKLLYDKVASIVSVILLKEIQRTHIKKYSFK